MIQTDAELLRRYACEHSEEAFSELVARHVNMVYAAALRQTQGNQALAEEVTQSVFTDLARKAPALSNRASVAGWCYTGVRFAALKLFRSEKRRKGRELEASHMQQLDISGESESDIPRLRIVLDDAMQELVAADREAIVLRHLEGRDLKTVGHDLGLSEEAARKRVERAMDKLQGILEGRGIRSTHAALSAGLAGLALASTPPGLTAAIANTALAGAATASLLHQVMNAFQTKTAIAGAALVAGLSTILVHQYRMNERLGRENDQLIERTSNLESIQTEIQRLAGIQEEFDRLRREHLELMRLRNQVAILGRELSAATSALSRASKTLGTNLLASPAENLPSALVRHTGKASVKVPTGQTLQMGGWPIEDGKKLMIYLTPEIVESQSTDAPAQIMVTTRLVAVTGAPIPVSDSSADARGSPSIEVSGWSGVTSEVALPVTALLDQSQVEMTKSAEQQNGSRMFASPRFITFDGQQAQVAVTRSTRLGDNGEVTTLGPTVNVTPHIIEGGVELVVAAEINRLEGQPLIPNVSE